MAKLVKTSTGYLFVSAMPSQQELENQDRYNIIWNLTDWFDVANYEELFSDKVYLGNIPDYDIPQDIDVFSFQLEKVVDSLKLGGRVLIHCMAGHGRTGMALACVLMKLNNLSAEQALKIAKRICNGPETQKQVAFVKAFNQ